MYRSLSSPSTLKQVSPWYALFYRLGCWFLRRECDHAFLVRNPYSRTISFFQDKFRYNLERGRPGRQFEAWQDPQRLFFRYLNVKQGDRPEVIKDRLSSFLFKDFLKVLPEVYERDLHLLPQSRTLIWGFAISVPSTIFTELLKMEDEASLERLAEHFQVDLGIRLNATSKQNTDDWYSPENYTLINRLYRRDFELFGYDQLGSKLHA